MEKQTHQSSILQFDLQFIIFVAHIFHYSICDYARTLYEWSKG